MREGGAGWAGGVLRGDDGAVGDDAVRGRAAAAPGRDRSAGAGRGAVRAAVRLARTGRAPADPAPLATCRSRSTSSGRSPSARPASRWTSSRPASSSLERERRLTPPRCVDDLDPLHPLDPPEAASPRRDQPHRRAVPGRERLPGGGRRQQEGRRVAEREAAAVAGAGDDVDAAVVAAGPCRSPRRGAGRGGRRPSPAPRTSRRCSRGRRGRGRRGRGR